MAMRTKVFEPQFRGGSGEPLLLLHGGSAHWTNWQDVIPQLSNEYDVLAPSLGGHAGGAPLPDGPVTIDSYADSIEAVMEAAGWDTAHIAGNSLGGWTAMELARRGRARSVVALSPAGGWSDDARAARVRRYFIWSRRQIQLTRAVAPLGLRSRLVRRFAFKEVAVHGDRIPRDYAVEMLDIVLANDTRMFELAVALPLHDYPDPGVPVLIAWSEQDWLVPMPRFSDPWRAAVPHAEFRVIPGVGHVPMYDDPKLVATRIRDWIRQSQ